jgi:hypothetical protein
MEFVLFVEILVMAAAAATFSVIVAMFVSGTTCIAGFQGSLEKSGNSVIDAPAYA